MVGWSHVRCDQSKKLLLLQGVKKMLRLAGEYSGPEPMLKHSDFSPLPAPAPHDTSDSFCVRYCSRLILSSYLAPWWRFLFLRLCFFGGHGPLPHTSRKATAKNGASESATCQMARLNKQTLDRDLHAKRQLGFFPLFLNWNTEETV